MIELQPSEQQLQPSAVFVSAIPPSGSTIAANTSITLTFDNTPADVIVSSGTAVVTGKTVGITGPFFPGLLALTVAWTDGVMTLTYFVVAPDVNPPLITGGTIADGDEDVDPEAINNDGRIVITFSEEVTGNIALQTKGGDDVGWLGKVEGNKATLELVKGKEVRHDTVYLIAGRVADAAGNKTDISIIFVTKGKE